MILYHASFSVFTNSQVVVASVPTTIHPNAVAAVDSVCTSSDSRSIAVFATDDPAAAVAYLQAELNYNNTVNKNSQIHLYEVDMISMNKGSMRLIKEIEDSITAHKNIDALVEEYINPKMNWLFWEYYGPKFKVLRSLALPTEDEVNSWSTYYGIDSIKVEELSRIQVVQA